MSSLKNLQRVTYTNEMVMTLIELYKFHGKEFYYKNLLKSDVTYFQKNTIEKDATILVRLFNISVSEHRIKLLITKDSEPKTNDEKLVRNIKQIIELCNSKSNTFEHESSQVVSLTDRLFKDIKRIQFDVEKERGQNSLIEENRGKSKRDDLDIEFDYFRVLSTNGKNEITNLISNFYIDFINIKPFKESNEILGMILLYVLLQRHGFTSMKYVSFLEILEQRKSEFDEAVLKANFNWEKGYSDVEPLNNLIVSILLDIYRKMEDMIRDHAYDAQLLKSNNIEITIMNAPETFTREYISQRHPNVSKSTIDRTLTRLKEENKIKPLGTGRSAKWHKTNMQNDDFSMDKTLDLFSTIIDKE